MPSKLALNNSSNTQIKGSKNNSKSNAKKLAKDGCDVTKWKTIGGTARYQIKNNKIIGTTTINTPNTFLVSNKAYADF
ncbi:MAG: hypothetical protein IPO94_19775 [Saprospiraceae bacterium]|nr:hypothetical protein [Saprospiraceae bacterium]